MIVEAVKNVAVYVQHEQVERAYQRPQQIFGIRELYRMAYRRIIRIMSYGIKHIQIQQ